jgi:cytoskeletal protein RodZ
MPSRPRFSEMLLDRRRQLGLTVGQASQVLKLKEQVLIAFEEG